MKITIEADAGQKVFETMLLLSLKGLFETPGWIYTPILPGIIVKEDWEHYDELLNWIEEKEKC